jgi:hypothetical protein
LFEHGETQRKRGSVKALALLVGLLLGISGGGIQAQPDPGSTRLDNGRIQRLAPSLRAASRSDDSGLDDEASPALSSPSPTVVTELVSARPAAQTVPAAFAATSLDARFHYHARAPPAA